jgi:hypothetical protein
VTDETTLDGFPHDYGQACSCPECLPPCPICGSTETVELSRGEQTITICAECGAD